MPGNDRTIHLPTDAFDECVAKLLTGSYQDIASGGAHDFAEIVRFYLAPYRAHMRIECAYSYNNLC